MKEHCDGPCIILYTSEFCLWCDTMMSMLRDILEGIGFNDVVQEVDVVEAVDITSIPTIDLCGNRLVGIQDEMAMRNEIFKVILKPCFHSTIRAN